MSLRKKQIFPMSAAILLGALYSAAQPSLLHSFDGASKDGADPKGSPALANGILYGTTRYGGTANFGTVFQASTNGSNYAVLYHCQKTTADGSEPRGTPLPSGSVVYGTTSLGGATTNGTIFKLDTANSTFTILHDFTGSDGRLPMGDLIQNDTLLYGYTSAGGNSGAGTLFTIGTDGTGYTVLHHFAGGAADGATPCGSLILLNGVLYGQTTFGGSDNYGTVFRINPNGTGFTLLHQFSGGPWDGSHPQSSLTASGTTLYGTAPFGGTNGFGMLFKVNTNGSNYAAIYNFTGTATNGAHPYGALSLSGEMLYGMTTYGGVSNNGTLFRVRTDGADFELLNSFIGNENSGANPYGTPLLDGNLLYGITSKGGANNDGVLFSFDIPELHPGPPVASFTAGPTVGTAPLTVTFTSSTIGDVTNIFWDFGDGSTSNTMSSTVVRTYDSVGSYTVRLVASGAGGASTITQTDLIKAAAPPTGILAFYDPFDEAVSSGTTPENWVCTTPGTGEHSRIDSGSLSYPNLLDSQGNSWGLGQGTADYQRSVSGITNLAAGDKVYYSFLLRLNAPLDAFNSPYFRLYNTAAPTGSGLAVGWGTTNYVLNQMGFALGNRNSASFSSAPSSALQKTDEIYTAADTTYLIVVGYNREATYQASTVQLWVNPDSTSFGTTTPPAATITMPSYQNAGGFNGETIWNRIEFISNGSSAGVPNWQVDEFRVGTEWMDVVPAIPASVNPPAPQPPPPPTVGSGGGSFGSGQDVITWVPAQGSGFVYSVWYSTNLLTGFQPLETNLPDTVQSITNTINASPVFYKIEVQ